MKKILFGIFGCLALVAAVTLNGCKKDDTTAPVISLTGGSSQTQDLPSISGNGSWTEPGFSAADDEDGDLTSSVTVSGTVNPNRKGTYTLTYSVTDKADRKSTRLNSSHRT